MKLLSNYISVYRRYTRSVNLERDIDTADSVKGYVPTQKAIDVLDRFISSYLTPHSVRAWTLTGVYGTGKSSFAHFLASIAAPDTHQVKKNALKICNKTIASSIPQYKSFIKNLPSAGLVRAVGTAQREPVSHTIIRILHRGGMSFWDKKSQGRRPKALSEVESHG